MDYCLETTKVHILFNREFSEILFERMELESEFIMSCLEDYQVILEEADNTSNQQKTVGLWDRIKLFFRNLFGLFVEKTRGIYEANKKWMDENFNKIDKIDFTNLKIEMIPFWNISMDTMKSSANKITETFKNLARNSAMASKYKDMETIKKEVLKNNLDENGDLTNGLKNLYRVGHSKGPIKPVVLAGSQLQKQVQGFKDYCFNYNKDVEPFVRNLMNLAEKEIQVLEQMIKNAPVPVKDSFCLIENAFYKETELMYVMEADQPTQNTNNTQQTKPTQVTVTNLNDKNQAQKDQIKQRYNGMNADQLSFAKNVMQVYQLNISALMTVLEERFKAYMNALKAIVSEAGNLVDNVPTDNKQNVQQKEEPVKKEEGDKKDDTTKKKDNIVNKTVNRARELRNKFKKK